MVGVSYGCGDLTTAAHYLILVNSGGYFIYDVLGMYLFGLLELDMLIHHSLCIGGILAVVLSGHDLCHVVAGLFVAEVSNPAMHMRVMLRNIGKRYTLAYEYAEYTYFVMFFFGRIVMGHPVVYATVTCESMNVFGRLVSLGVLAQSYQFLYRMYFILRSRVQETSERNKLKLRIYWFEPMKTEDLEKTKFYKKKTVDRLP